MLALKPSRLARGTHAANSWDSHLATLMVRFFCDQHRVPHHAAATSRPVPAQASSRTPTHAALCVSRRPYHSGTGVSLDQDIPVQRQQPLVEPRQQPDTTQTPQPTISAFMMPPGTERHHNPYETIADSFNNNNRVAGRGQSRHSERPLSQFDPVAPRLMMTEAVNSHNAQQIWHTYTRLTSKASSSRNPPFSAPLYFRILHSLQATKSKEAAKWAHIIYNDMKKYHTPKTTTLNTMLDILARYEDVNRAIDFFHKEASMFKVLPNVRSYNIMIRALATNGQIKAAETIYEDMRSGVIPERPDVTTYSTLMSHYNRTGRQETADTVLDDMLKDNVKPNMWIFNSVVKRFVNQRDYTGARRVMTLMRDSDLKPDVVTYTTLIDGYAKDGNEEAIASIQTEMALDQVYPNAHTITSTIKVFARASLDSDIDGSLEAILKSLPIGEMNDLTFGVLMNVYGKRKDMDAAMGIYRHMSAKGPVNDVIVCSLLDGYVRSDDIPTANKIFMEHYTTRGVRPSSAWSYSIMITGCCKQGDLESALHFYHEMNSFYIEPDSTICSRLIQLYLEHHQPDNAQQMLRLMRNSHLVISVHTYTMLMDYLSSVKDFRGALRYYQQMLDAGIQPDVHCYTVLINSHIRAKNYPACDLTFEQMTKAGVMPTLEALTSMIRVHSLQGNVSRVKEYWSVMTTMGLIPDLKAFTALMQTYSQQSNVEMVEFIFQELVRKQLKVDAILLTTLISAYSALPRLNVSRVEELSTLMEDLELDPTPEHFKLLLDTFGEHGMPDRVIKTWVRLQNLAKPLEWIPSTSNLLHLIEACRDRGYIDTLHAVWNTATVDTSRSRRDENANRTDTLFAPPTSLPAPTTTTARLTPAPEVFTAYLNALLTHNRFSEIEVLLNEGCREMRMTPRAEDFELLFSGLAQYEFLKNELTGIRQIVVERWPRVASTVDRIIRDTRRI